ASSHSGANRGISYHTGVVYCCGGLINRRPRWGLSCLGWCAAILVWCGVVGLFLLGVYPFLAVTERVPADTLVVEGWIPPFAIRAAVDEFRSGSYKQVITTGGPAMGTGRLHKRLQHISQRRCRRAKGRRDSSRSLSNGA